MRKKLTNNIWAKLGSLACAIVIWLVIQSIADPVETKQFTDFPVEIRNESVLTQEDDKYTYTIVNGSTASFTIEGKSSIVNGLSASDFVVYADMSKLSQVGAVPIEIETKRSGVDVEIWPHSNTLIVEVDELVEKSVSVMVQIEGELREGYTTGDIESNPNLVKVSGPKTLIDTAQALVVTVNVNGQGGIKDASGTEQTMITATEASPKLIDRNGDVITASTVNIDLAQPITVNVEILKTEEVELVLKFDGFRAAEGYAIVGAVEYSPTRITLAGTKEALEAYLKDKPTGESGKIIEKTVSGKGIEPLAANFESFYELTVAEDIRIIDETVREKGIAYQITVEEKIISAYPTTFDKIKLIGADASYTYRLEDESDGGKLSFNVTGIAADMDQINSADPSSVQISLDVTGLEPGTYTQTVVGTFPSGVELVKGQELTIVIEGPKESE